MRLSVARPTALPQPPLWLFGLLAVSTLLCLQVIAAMAVVPSVRDGAIDWNMLLTAGERITSGADPFESSDPAVYAWRWSPFLAYAFAAIAPIGLLGWSVLHFAALALLREWRLIALFLVAWPFWVDLDVGNVMTFVAVAGVLALRGSLAWQLVFVTMAILMPRPLMLPLVAWIVWQQPRTRLPALMIAVAHTIAVIATGWGDEWLDVLVGSAADQYGAAWNFGPSRFVGSWWLLIGLPIGAWCTWRGRIGLASLAVSPYWLPQYFLMLILEAVRPDRMPTDAPARGDRTQG